MSQEIINKLLANSKIEFILLTLLLSLCFKSMMGQSWVSSLTSYGYDVEVDTTLGYVYLNYQQSSSTGVIRVYNSSGSLLNARTFANTYIQDLDVDQINHRLFAAGYFTGGGGGSWTNYGGEDFFLGYFNATLTAFTRLTGNASAGNDRAHAVKCTGSTSFGNNAYYGGMRNSAKFYVGSFFEGYNPPSSTNSSTTITANGACFDLDARSTPDFANGLDSIILAASGNPNLYFFNLTSTGFVPAFTKALSSPSEAVAIDGNKNVIVCSNNAGADRIRKYSAAGNLLWNQSSANLFITTVRVLSNNNVVYSACGTSWPRLGFLDVNGMNYKNEQTGNGTILRGLCVEHDSVFYLTGDLTGNFSYNGYAPLTMPGPFVLKYNPYPSSPLPVELLSFEAKAISHNKVLLSWSTASELNNDYFELERSSEGADFTTVGIIPGNGTASTIKDYEYTDKTPFAGLNYYRLKQTDFDGSVNYLKTISVRTAVISGIQIFSAPHGRLIIHQPNFNQGLRIELFTLNGVKYREWENLILSNNEISLDNIAPGIYIVTVSDEQEQITGKILIQ